jgi:hypothetical protein
MTGGHDRQARFMLEWLEYEVQYRAQPQDKDKLLQMLSELVDMLDLGAVSGEGLDWDAYRDKVRDVRRLIYGRDV